MKKSTISDPASALVFAMAFAAVAVAQTGGSSGGQTGGQSGSQTGGTSTQGQMTPGQTAPVPEPQPIPNGPATNNSQPGNSSAPGNPSVSAGGTSDGAITFRVQRSIESDKGLAPILPGITISTNQGTVILRGMVKSEDDKTNLAARAAAEVGPDHVNNLLVVQP